MFHILVARFILEANENIPKKCNLNDVSLHFGQGCIAHLQLGDVFDRPDVTLVPALDANAASNGVMKRTAFDYIESTILQTVQEHLSELDGMSCWGWWQQTSVKRGGWPRAKNWAIKSWR